MSATVRATSIMPCHTPANAKPTSCGAFPSSKPRPLATQMPRLLVDARGGELRLQIGVYRLGVVLVHVRAGAVAPVLEQPLRPGAIVVAHHLRHRLHPLDVEEDDRAFGEPLLQRRGDRVVRVGPAALGRDEIGIAASSPRSSSAPLAAASVCAACAPTSAGRRRRRRAPTPCRRASAACRSTSRPCGRAREVVADPAVRRARRGLPGLHRLVARIGVGVEPHVLAVRLRVGHRRLLPGDRGGDLSHLRRDVGHLRLLTLEAGLGGRAAARDGDPSDTDDERRRAACDGVSERVSHAAQQCNCYTRLDGSLVEWCGRSTLYRPARCLSARRASGRSP